MLNFFHPENPPISSSNVQRSKNRIKSFSALAHRVPKPFTSNVETHQKRLILTCDTRSLPQYAVPG